MGDTEQISLSDRYATLLEKSIKENAELRQAILKRDEEQKEVLRRLEEKLSSSSTSGEVSRKRQLKVKVNVPQICKQDFRKMYKLLKTDHEDFQGFDLQERFESKGNKEATSQVLASVQSDHGGVEKCPWSPAQLKGAAAVYYKSLRDAKLRKEKGKSEDHAIRCRRQGRIRDKSERRMKALGMVTDWSEAKKKAVKAALTKDYMSSDESEWSEEEAGPVLRGYATKKLPWERSRFTKIKKELDLVYYKSLSAKSRGMMLKRTTSQQQSSRAPPSNRIQWAVREERTVLVSTPLRTSNNSGNSISSLDISPIF